MEENIRQLALISSVLGGFSFTFLSTCLTSKMEKTKVNFVMLVFLSIASMSFLLSALGWSLMDFQSERIDLASHHQFLVKSLILGLNCVIIALGLSGWMRDVKTGIVTSIVSAITLFLLFSEILSRYLTF